mmetsp:Transcript_25322/g.33062  ORF Transcript_25322/g.33062 Transcript_25322/m.33062 type:complete len:114 (+) Transcript_25322:490-831(+)
MRRLLSPSEIQDYDLSTRLGGADVRNLHGDFEDNNERNNHYNNKGNNDGNNETQRQSNSNCEIRKVRDMSLNQFQSKLIKQFNIKYKRKEIIWSRKGKVIHSILFFFKLNKHC